MANYLKMAKVSAILTLKEHGWSQRRIARELGIHPDTVGRYVNLSGVDSKPVKASPGSEDSKPVKAPPGSDDQNPSQGPLGRSQCEPFRLVIDVGSKLIILAVIGAIATLVLGKVIKG